MKNTLLKTEDLFYEELEKLVKMQDLMKTNPEKITFSEILGQLIKFNGLSPNPQYSKTEIRELENKIAENPLNIIQKLESVGLKKTYEDIQEFFERNLLNKYVITILPYYGEAKLVFTSKFFTETMGFRFTGTLNQNILARRILLAFVQLKNVIKKGQLDSWKQNIYEPDKNGRQKHKNTLFIKIYKELVDTDGKKFEATLTVKYPKGYGRVWPYKLNVNKEILDAVQENPQILMKLEVSLG